MTGGSKGAGRSALALRHVHFEDLGAFEPVLREKGYDVAYHDAGSDDPAKLSAADPDLLIVLGGPFGAYEDDAYPFLTAELALIERRLAAERPILGICLGAQLMARALGARVYPGSGKEIGYAPIALTEAGRRSCLAPFGEDGATVLHWHGDTFDLPEGSTLLASTDRYEHQAFARGRNAIAFQFHPEARHLGFERWLIGHACEIAAAPGVTVEGLRADAARCCAGIEKRARPCLEAWLSQVQVEG